jgi:hypothetical protein
MKRALLLLLVLLLVVLSACTGGVRGQYNPQLIDYYVGTEGITLDFLEGTPPDEVNENQNFQVQAVIHNKGAYDVRGDQVISIEVVHDSALLSAFDAEVQSEIQLNGKSFSYRNGEQDFFVLANYKANTVFGSFERAEPTLYTTLCYPYQTNFAREICVDTDITNTDVRTQACEIDPVLNFPQGQGAPVAITKVETTFEAVGPYALPAFTFTVENKGDGFAYGADSSVCAQPDEDTIYALGFSASLGNETLNCPTEIKLENGKTEVNCFMNSEGFLLTRANYVSVLAAEIQYRYVESFSEEIVINRRTDFGFDNTYDGACAPWDVLVDNKCVSFCSYCAGNPSADGCTSDEALSTNPNVNKAVLPSATCLYTKQECIRQGDNCITEEGTYCIPGLYCGVPECAYNPNKNSAPNAGIEFIADESKVTWFCSDRDGDLNLHSACGCKDVSSYAFTASGLDCPDSAASYTDVTGFHNPGLRKTFFSVDRPPADQDISAICVTVEDVLGKTSTKKLNLV